MIPVRRVIFRKSTWEGRKQGATGFLPVIYIVASIAGAANADQYRDGARLDGNRAPAAGLFRAANNGKRAMNLTRKFWACLLASLIAMTAVSMPATAQQQQRPNIVEIGRAVV